MSIFPKKFDHNLDDKVYKQREASGAFEPNKNSRTKKKFVIPLPPPNVTGILHMGHCMMLSVQDILCRYHRMIGDETVRIPGTDHAGISTQVVVEKNLLKEEGLSRFDIGREKFVSKVRDRALKSRSNIINQTKKMGSSCDRSREEFTLSEQLSRAVRKSFSNLYNKGKIYQGNYITNRSVGCQTVVSDIEIEYQENEGKLYYVNYFIDGKGDYITIATTRPETLFADVAVAVNPYDKRYKKIIGKKVLIPIINRPIPVIADELVDMSFGTGALKITPTHDPLDFEIAKKHNLPMNVYAFDKHGNFTEHAGELFVGKNIDEFFGNVVQHLKEVGNLDKIEPYKNTIPICDRSKTRIQPMLSKQRFFDVNEAAQNSLKMLDKDDVKVYPPRYDDTLRQWLTNIRPWCISRQLRRGHRIPVWYDDKNNIHVFDEDKLLDAYSESKSKSDIVLSLMIFNLVADSRLVNPFNVEQLVSILFEQSITAQRGKVGDTFCQMYGTKFGDDKNISKQVKSLKEIFGSFDEPKQIEKLSGKLIDILENSFGVVKKGDLYEFDFEVMAPGSKGLRQDEDVFDTWFSSALRPFSILGWPEKTPDFEDFYPSSVLVTGWDIIFFRVARMMIMADSQLSQKPFDTIYLTGLVRDEKGNKMSKSKGNGIDPIEMINEFGADSVRLSMITGSTPGNDVNFSKTKLDYYHRFTNKLWNASRFVVMNVFGEEGERNLNYTDLYEIVEQNISKLNDFDIWILNNLNALIARVDEAFEKYQLGEASQEIIDLVRSSYCDRYIEISKIEKSDYTNQVNLYVLATILKIIHPFAPYVSEQLWKHIGFDGTLMLSDRPKEMPGIEKNYKIGLLMNIITESRNIRNTLKLKNHEQCKLFLQSNNDNLVFFKKYESLIMSLIKASEVQFLRDDDTQPKDFMVGVVANVNVGIQGILVIDKKTHCANLEKQLHDEEQYLQDMRVIVSNPSFLSNAPKDLVEAKKKKMDEIKDKIEKLSLEISRLKMG